MTNEKLKQRQDGAEVLASQFEEAIKNRAMAYPELRHMEDLYAFWTLISTVCEVARRLPPPLDDTE